MSATRSIRIMTQYHRLSWTKLHKQRELVARGILALSCSFLGCGGSGSYVWVSEAPDAYFTPPPAMAISPGDLVSVKVFAQEPLSIARAVVRVDGNIAMPLIGDIPVAGRSPSEVAKDIETKLIPFVTTPNVIVSVEESKIRIVAIGELRRTGTIILEAGETGILPAIANAGGLTEFGGKSDIYVVRHESSGTHRIRFEYNDVIRGVGRTAVFRLRTGDQLVVE